MLAFITRPAVSDLYYRYLWNLHNYGIMVEIYGSIERYKNTT